MTLILWSSCLHPQVLGLKACATVPWLCGVLLLPEVSLASFSSLNFLKIFIYFVVHVFVWAVVATGMLKHMCGGWETAFENWFSPAV